LKNILLQPQDRSQSAAIAEEPGSMSAPVQIKGAGKLRVQGLLARSLSFELNKIINQNGV
jgi:hypothetical protein